MGCWLLESFAWANDQLGLRAGAHVLTRSPAAFARKAPHLAGNPAIVMSTGDVRTCEFPAGNFGFVIHAATDASVALNRAEPLRMLDTITLGTRRTLDMAVGCGARRFLFTSSGAVYGRQPPELEHVPEDFRGAPDPIDTAAAYGEGKRVAELLCSIYAREKGLGTSIARCFAFIGPHLPLDGSFAAGNFVRDRLHGDVIRIDGDGTPRRSYLYGSDLAAWLWTLLFRGPAGRAYNVGSEDDVSIEELARMVAVSGDRPPCPVTVAKQASPGTAAERYVPSTRRISAELGLRPTVDLDESIARTLRWNAEYAR